MKRFTAIVLVLLCAISSVVFAGGASQPSGTTGKEVLSAPGVLPITREKSYMNVFIAGDSISGPDLANNTVFTEFEALTNVHLNMNIAIEEAGEKLNLLLASGDYPEVILTGVDQMRYGVQEGILIPVNDLIEQHAPNAKVFYNRYPWIKESMTAPDGNMYGIPGIGGGVDAVSHEKVSYKLWFNTQWLNNLGLSAPTTTEEFRTVLRAFKTRDPNGNGRADEIPLSGAKGTWAADPWLFLFNAFGYWDESLVVLRNGTYTPLANQDYLRDAISYVKSLYDEGLIDPAAFTQTMEQMAVIGNNPGDIIMGAFTSGHIAMGLDISDVERSKQYTTLLPLKGPGGYQAIPFADTRAYPINPSFSITDKCKNPALAIKWADAFSTEYWMVRSYLGIKGRDWDYADPGTFAGDGVTPARFKQLVNIGYSGGSGNTDRYEGFKILGLERHPGDLTQFMGDIYDPVNYLARLTQETVKFQPYAAVRDHIPPLVYDVDASNRLGQIQPPIVDYVNTAIVEFITGNRVLNDAAWNTYKQDLDRLGYPEMVQIMQTAYNKKYK
ncbi:MAG: extracellular solute-binding protein [Treponema sp.]|jgi:putative aldouronate transport system substrate-binding protein|nr:extracellular solute-binding protein [Treponema sp.]